ncbi:MAG: indole-3-glycerol phosphate synthase/ N-(5'-phospho-ribosyl)anthranilate isomerase [Candidatus Peregrinibacteria bacterium GW2011_GWF2_39_17]|nr:MAG: indole-3-glycerol phosphate synthase/ N-(5'-phospho-ribosyl)anthranilate isomerase [Candidatus Peregrinibacteria bacterium GW2011_GWF2_39_17]HCW32807.1 indole-3-glycerol-phosphate synthase TrpC [Candidatus Peregrinibacteria bacterium]
MNFLKELLPIKLREIEDLKKNPPQFKPAFKRASFKKALTKKKSVHLIGEIKFHSPSRGFLTDESIIPEILPIYNRYMSAISVLTDEHFFKGSFQYLNRLTDQTTLPLLAKDFFLDPFQIDLAKRAGASAILLIAKLLKAQDLQMLYKTAQDQGLDVLVEIHDEADLEKALNLDSEIIGINHRNLENLEIDLKTTHRLRPLIPKNKIVVAESGIRNRLDIEGLLPINAALIGTSLMTTEDPLSLIKSLCKV